MKRTKYAVITAVVGLAVMLSAWGLTKLTQVAIVNSTIDSTPIGNSSASTVNSSGYRYNGAAPLGHTLVGDGSHYVDAAPATGQVVAEWQGTSCTFGDGGDSGSACQATQSWGTTISGSYNYWCQPSYVSAVSCGNLESCSSITFNTVSQSSTDFTYIVTQRGLNNARTHTVQLDCWATN